MNDIIKMIRRLVAQRAPGRRQPRKRDAVAYAAVVDILG